MIINAIKDKLLIPKIESKDIKAIKEVRYENLSLNLERNNVSEDNITDTVYKSKLSDLINFNNNDIDELEDTDKVIDKIENDNEFIEEVEQKEKIPELYPIGLALGTYIVCENERGIYLIDQHAAQERINYEKFSYLLSHPSDNIMETLVPIVIELPVSDFLIINKNKEILDRLNIKVEEFGISSYRVVSHPTWLTKGREEILIRNIFEMIKEEEKDFDLAKFLDHLAATMACKASVKGNTRITLEDMESIINQMRDCNNPYHCPHGRPTMISFSEYELGKKFKRII